MGAVVPFTLGVSWAPAGVCSHIFTVRSKDDDAIMEPNSGWAHDTFDTAASCACEMTSDGQSGPQVL